MLRTPFLTLFLALSVEHTAPEDGWVCPPCGEACHDILHEAPGSCLECGMDLVATEQVPRVAVLLFEGVDLLTSTTPLGILAKSNAAIVYTVADTTDPIRIYDTLEVLPEYAFSEAPLPDVLVLPSGYGAAEDPLILDWVRRAGAHARVVLSIEAGSLLAVEADLVEGGSIAGPAFLQRYFETAQTEVRLDSERAVQRNGKLISVRNAGACTEAVMDLVHELVGTERAERAATRMGLDWSPRVARPAAGPGDGEDPR